MNRLNVQRLGTTAPCSQTVFRNQSATPDQHEQTADLLVVPYEYLKLLHDTNGFAGNNLEATNDESEPE